MLNPISDIAPVKTIEIEEHLKKIHEDVKNLTDAPSSHVSINETSKQLEAIKTL